MKRDKLFRELRNSIGALSMVAGLLIIVPNPANAQNSVAAPGGAFNPRPMGGNLGGPGPGGGPGPAPSWGSPWGGNSLMVVNTPLSTPTWQNNGFTTVMACGYDAQGVWRTLPLRVSYNFNGVNYNVEVINAWNPWTQMWNYGVDQNAYSTSYYLNGQTFNYYAPLSTGTYYFNL